MAFGPVYAELPLSAATPTRPASRFVDETSWARLIGNFSTWQGPVNANAQNLSNVNSLTASVLRINGATPRGQIDVNGVITISNFGNVGGVDHSGPAYTGPGGGMIAWNKQAGAGDISIINLSDAGGVNGGGVSFYDKNTQILRVNRVGDVNTTSLPPEVHGGIRDRLQLYNSGGGSNTDGLVVRSYRHGAPLGWGSFDWQIIRVVDGSPQGHISFGAGAVSIGALGTYPIVITGARVRLHGAPSYASLAAAIAGGEAGATVIRRSSDGVLMMV